MLLFVLLVMGCFLRISLRENNTKIKLTHRVAQGVLLIPEKLLSTKAEVQLNIHPILKCITNALRANVMCMTH